MVHNWQKGHPYRCLHIVFSIPQKASRAQTMGRISHYFTTPKQWAVKVRADVQRKKKTHTNKNKSIIKDP